MHNPVDERLDETRLVFNPVGYPHESKQGFNPTFCIEIKEAKG